MMVAEKEMTVALVGGSGSVLDLGNIGCGIGINVLNGEVNSTGDGCLCVFLVLRKMDVNPMSVVKEKAWRGRFV